MLSFQKAGSASRRVSLIPLCLERYSTTHYTFHFWTHRPEDKNDLPLISREAKVSHTPWPPAYNRTADTISQMFISGLAHETFGSRRLRDGSVIPHHLRAKAAQLWLGCRTLGGTLASDHDGALRTEASLGTRYWPKLQVEVLRSQRLKNASKPSKAGSLSAPTPLSPTLSNSPLAPFQFRPKAAAFFFYA